MVIVLGQELIFAYATTMLLLLVVLQLFLEWKLILAVNALVSLLLGVMRYAVVRLMWSLTRYHLAFSHAN